MNFTQERSMNRGRRRGTKVLVLASTLAAALLPATDALAISCSIVSTSAVSFGNYNVFDTSPLDTTGSLTFNCTGVGGSDTIVVDLSAGGASSVFSRRMLQASEPLSYNLYTDGAHTVVWGDGSGGTGHYGPVVPPNGTNDTITIYARVPAQQNVSVGPYDDTIVATILF